MRRSVRVSAFELSSSVLMFVLIMLDFVII